MLQALNPSKKFGLKNGKGAEISTQGGVPQELFFGITESLPINVIVCDAENLEVFYANPASINTLRTIEHLLPIKADNLIGTCIDVFHKDPSHQRRMLANPANLPHKAEIALGEETLSLDVFALNDAAGNYIAAAVVWSVITNEKHQEAESQKLLQMLDQLPVNVMIADPQELVVSYMNQTSKNTLKQVEHLLPCSADEVVGSCIDIFHKQPEVQRKMLADANNLPYETNIDLGGEHKLSLKVSAVFDEAGTYTQALLAWNVVTEQIAVAEKVDNASSTVASAATELKATAATMSQSIDQMKAQSASVASVAEQTSGNVGAVASAAEELAASTDEISRQVAQSSEVAGEAQREATEAASTVKSLDEAGQKIGDVVNLINDIASQTNLLALNATIEAARAGEAGKGFAVVASEVKALAQQTANATEDITKQIEAMQDATGQVVTAIDSITATIGRVNEASTGISAAVEEQSAATQEIARNTQQVSSGTAEVSTAAQTVSEAAEQAAAGVAEVNVATDELSVQAESMSSEIKIFLEGLGVKG